MDVTDAGVLSKTRRSLFSAFAVLFALVFGLGFFGWVFLLIGWFASGDEQIHRVHDIGAFGVAMGLFVATPLLILSWRREDIALVQMLGVAAVATLIGSVLALDWGFLLSIVILAIPLVVLLTISKGWKRFTSPGTGIDRELLVAAIVAAPFWGAFALTMAKLQRVGPANDPHVEMHHWTGMATMGIGLVLMAALASTRTRGWRIVAMLTGLGSIVYGVASVLFATYPGSTVAYPGSEGSFWGSLAIVWGAAFIALAERRARAT